MFIREWLKDRYDLPVFLMGHSYGSFLSQAFAQEGTDVKAIALIGSGHMRSLFTLGKIFTFPIWLVARNWRPRIVNFLSDNFPKFKGDEGKWQWVNSVREKREEMLADPYGHTHMSVNFDYYMMKETSKLYGRKAQAKLNPATAMGMFSGGADLVGRNGKGVRKLEKCTKPTASTPSCISMTARAMKCFTIGVARICKKTLRTSLTNLSYTSKRA